MVPLHVKLSDLFVMEPGPYLLKSVDDHDDIAYDPMTYLAITGKKDGRKFISIYHLTSHTSARWASVFYPDDDWLAPEEQTTYKCWSIMHPLIDVAEHLE